MKKTIIVALFAWLCAPSNAESVWPEATRECRPHAYWWWLGSAVDKANLTREMERYKEAGMGGVHIIPIYGAKGYEDKYIPYLSKTWMEMLNHVVSEGKRLDLNVDMTTGTGWCFGGPKVTPDEACSVLDIQTLKPNAGEPLTARLKPGAMAVAVGPKGETLDLSKQITDKVIITWQAPEKGWRVMIATTKPTLKVKRAAPGGEGWMINLFYPQAMDNYLAVFEEAFGSYNGLKPRAMYHDSYEYRCNWSPTLLDAFEKRRGYSLRQQLPVLLDTKRMDDQAQRVRYDYRDTLSDLMIEETLARWVKWCHAKAIITRNQAHGSPGNLLDLYALVDIPETEMFDNDRSKFVSKFSSSAAHVMGRRLVSAETGTWLREHFTETLGDLKSLLDDLFLSGVNHVIYHGTCYSPDEAAWPGWLFYASYEMNPRNSLWHDAPSVNRYIARCQAVLQAGRSDNDLLVYWPVHEYWRTTPGLELQMGVHNRAWLEQQPIGALAEQLWKQGYTFDYISDRQLQQTRVESNMLTTPGNRFSAVLVPAAKTLPLATLQQLIRLAEAGGTVLFDSEMPSDVPGLSNLDENRATFKQILQKHGLLTPTPGGCKKGAVGKGFICIGPASQLLSSAGIKPEQLMAQAHLSFLRRAHETGSTYFLVNETTNVFNGWIALSRSAQAVQVLDPMTGKSGLGACRKNKTTGELEVYLQLNPEETLILKTEKALIAQGSTWAWNQAGKSHPVHGPWAVEFIKGGPVLPAPYTTDKLASWTTQGNEETRRFAGTARYTTTFHAPATAATPYYLDLGNVCQSARVTLNGVQLGTPFIAPFRVFVPTLKPIGNKLEIEVTNVAANRIRDLDRRKVPWKYFHEINFVNIKYKPFDAAEWPLYDSGLLGPVTLIEAAPSL